MQRPRRIYTIGGSLVALAILVTVGIYAERIRSIHYHAAVEATLRNHLGLSVSVGHVTPLSNGSHWLGDVTVYLQDGGEAVFSCKEAKWLRQERSPSSPDSFVLTVRDGWLLLSETGWTRVEYDKILESGLGHDFAELGLKEVRFENMDLRLRQPLASFTAENTTGTAQFEQARIGTFTLTTSRLNGVDVAEPVQISGTFTTGKVLALGEVGLRVPKMPIAVLGLPGLEVTGTRAGSFAGKVRYKKAADGDILSISGSLTDADLHEVTQHLPGGPYHGRVDLEVETAEFRDNVLQRLVGRGHISDIRMGEFLPGTDQFVEGRLDLNISDIEWHEGKIANFSASGSCEDVSLEALSSLFGSGKVTGTLSIDIRSLVARNDKLIRADITIESTTKAGQPGTIDRELIGKLGEMWTGLNMTSMLPSQVQYTRLGARLILEEDQLRVLGTHGDEGRTILTVNAFGRPWGIIKQLDRTFKVPDLVALARTKAKEVDPQRAAAWWKLRHLSERYWNARMQRYPTQATAIGDFRFNDQLTDVSAEALAGWQSTLESLLSDARALSSRDLNRTDALTRDLLARTLDDELQRLGCHLERMPLDPLYGPHIEFPLLIVTHPFRNVSDFEAYIARLHAFGNQVDNHIANMREGMRHKTVSSRLIIEKVIPQIRMHIVSDVTKSEFYKPIRHDTRLAKSDRDSFETQIREAIQTSVVPAYEKLLAFVTDQYLPACRDTVGISAVPGGDAIYETLCRLHTSVTIPPSQIHQLGLAEVARIREQMAVIQDEVGFDGSLDEFLAHMRDDPKYRFTSAKELYDTADGILQRTKPKMKRLFGTVPKADCVMKEMEEFRAKSAPAAFYNPTSDDGSRPGYYYINTYAPQKRPRFTLEALTYHESVPGHHLQIALDRENKQLPKFRRHGSFTAYVEGWALYAEKLGYEIGGYGTADSRFGQLTFEMWRACRLVVDTGMHAQGWTRQQAIDYMLANTSLAPIDIEAEVDRYIAWPAQALAYKIGELRILKIRRQAEQQLGRSFDLRNFHDALLSGGAMPIDILEKRMDRWISGGGKFP